MKWSGKDRDLRKRIDELELEILQTDSCKDIDRDLEKIFTEIKRYLPEDKQHLIKNAEYCLTEGLILYKDYFYKNGYLDNTGFLNLKRVFRFLVSWLWDSK